MRLFVSYASANGKVVRSLVRDLRLFKHEVWYDDELVGGTPWWSRILSEIRAADGFVYVASSESAQSVACQRELAYALALGLPVLPLAVGDGDPAEQPPAIAALELRRFTGRRREEPAELHLALSQLSPRPALPDPLPPEPAAPGAAPKKRTPATARSESRAASPPAAPPAAAERTVPGAGVWAGALAPGLGAALLAIGLGPHRLPGLPDALRAGLSSLGGGGILALLVAGTLLLGLASWPWAGHEPAAQVGLAAVDNGPGALVMLALLYGVVQPLGATADEWAPMVLGTLALHALGVALGVFTGRSWLNRRA